MFKQTTVNCPPIAVPGIAAPDPRVIRQLWGLAVRGERALRATAPLWLAQRAAWGEEAADLLASTAEPASWLSEGVRQGSVILPATATIPLAHLLLSSAAMSLRRHVSRDWSPAFGYSIAWTQQSGLPSRPCLPP